MRRKCQRSPSAGARYAGSRPWPGSRPRELPLAFVGQTPLSMLMAAPVKGHPLQAGIGAIQWSYGADHEGLAPLTGAEGDPIGDGNTHKIIALAQNQ